jgi:hypothetical protein
MREEMKAAVVIFPDAIGFASPELNHAVALVCGQLYAISSIIESIRNCRVVYRGLSARIKPFTYWGNGKKNSPT